MAATSPGVAQDAAVALPALAPRHPETVTASSSSNPSSTKASSLPSLSDNARRASASGPMGGVGSSTSLAPEAALSSTPSFETVAVVGDAQHSGMQEDAHLTWKQAAERKVGRQLPPLRREQPLPAGKASPRGGPASPRKQVAHAPDVPPETRAEGEGGSARAIDVDRGSDGDGVGKPPYQRPPRPLRPMPIALLAAMMAVRRDLESDETDRRRNGESYETLRRFVFVNEHIIAHMKFNVRAALQEKQHAFLASIEGASRLAATQDEEWDRYGLLSQSLMETFLKEAQRRKEIAFAIDEEVVIRRTLWSHADVGCLCICLNHAADVLASYSYRVKERLLLEESHVVLWRGLLTAEVTDWTLLTLALWQAEVDLSFRLKGQWFFDQNESTHRGRIEEEQRRMWFRDVTVGGRVIQLKNLLDAKKIVYFEALGSVMRCQIVFEEARERLWLEFISTRSVLVKDLKDFTRALAADDRGDLRFIRAVSDRKRRQHLEDFEALERDDIIDKYDGWCLWLVVEAAVLAKRAFFAHALRQATTIVFDQVACLALEDRCRSFAASGMDLWHRQSLFEEAVCQLKCLQAGAAAADVERSLRESTHGRLVVAFQTVAVTARAFQVRLAMFQLLRAEIPKRRQGVSISRLHDVARAWMTREALRHLLRRKRQVTLAATRFIGRMARGYACRRAIADAHAERRDWIKSIVFAKMLLCVEREADGRIAIMRDEHHASMPFFGLTFHGVVYGAAATTLHRCVRGFVVRQDLKYFRVYGEDPLRNMQLLQVSSSAALRHFSHVLNWHSLAANHSLWNGALCDRWL